MRVRHYSPQDRNLWNDFVKTSKNGVFLFDRNYMDYHADRFDDHSLMFYDEQDKVVALLPANLRDNVLYSHQGLTFGGFVTNSKMRMPVMLDMFAALRDYARANGFAKIIYKAIPYFYHKQPAQEDLYALFRMQATCYRIDVSSTIDKTGVPYAFSSSRKSGLKKARDNYLEVTSSEDFAAFFALMDAVLDDKYQTKSTHNADEMALLHGRFPKNIHLHVVHEAGQMIAGIIIYETDTTAHTQYIGSSPRGKETGATDLILDYLINERYKAKSYFDFGISTEQNGQYLNENLIAQKEGAGARATIHQFFELLA